MMDDGLGDWRHWAATRLAADMKAAGPGAPAHKAGSPIYQSAITRDSYGRVVAFTMPSPTALALNISIGAARRADEIRRSLNLVSIP